MSSRFISAALFLPFLAAVTPSSAFAQKPTDPQIAAIVVAANSVDISAGRRASRTTHNRAVRAFAMQMVTDHSAVNKAATDLVTRLHVTPEASATSRELTAGGKTNEQSLRGKHGRAFDRAYIDHEVAYHQAVLNAIDSTLVPSATNADLKALLVQTRPAFVAHLAHAQRVQAELK